MDTYTVLFVPDHNARVRRYRVSGRLLRRGLGAVAVAVLVVAVGGADYVRARLETRELERLREETAQQRDRLEGLTGEVSQLEARLARVRELERKVRVIADLPEPAGVAVSPPGVGGEGDEEDLPTLSIPDAEPDAEGEVETSSAGAGRPGGQGGGDPEVGAASPGAPHAARVAGLHNRAARLNTLAESRAKSLEDLVESLQTKRRRLASTPSIWPAKGWVTSGYGYRTSPFTGRRQFHGGVDIAGRPGTPVVAPARGQVVFVGRKGPLGKAVTLDHGYGVRTTFGHNAEILVERGEEVERGQEIARLGSSGRSTGPHVHYAVQVDGRRVNPMNYILDE